MEKKLNVRGANKLIIGGYFMIDIFEDDFSEEGLPLCKHCGDECVVGYGDCIQIDYDEYQTFCSQTCFTTTMMKENCADYI